MSADIRAICIVGSGRIVLGTNNIKRVRGWVKRVLRIDRAKFVSSVRKELDSAKTVGHMGHTAHQRGTKTGRNTNLRTHKTQDNGLARLRVDSIR